MKLTFFKPANSGADSIDFHSKNQIRITTTYISISKSCIDNMRLKIGDFLGFAFTKDENKQRCFISVTTSDQGYKIGHKDKKSIQVKSQMLINKIRSHFRIPSKQIMNIRVQTMPIRIDGHDYYELVKWDNEQ